MNRRDFLKLTGKSVVALCATTAIPGCMLKRDAPIVSDDVKLPDISDNQLLALVRVHATLDDGTCVYRDWVVPVTAKAANLGGIDLKFDGDISFVADAGMVVTDYKISIYERGLANVIVACNNDFLHPVYLKPKDKLSVVLDTNFRLE